MKKLNEKEPFYASVYKRNFLKSGKKVKINKYSVGIEVEVCFYLKKTFFLSKGIITKNNVTKFISHMAPCIEVVGYRQKRFGVTSFGDLCSDFGGNVKFIIGQKKKFKKINIGNLKTNISNKKIKQSINGNTNTVYIDPLNSLKFVLNKLKKDKIKLNKDFYVFTGSTVGIVPILGKGVYTGKIDKLGSVKAIIS
jgi:2-keto-4-pentenoate hydratase